VATDVPPTALAAQAVPDRARALPAVEQDGRTMPTGLGEGCPIGGRNARRTRAQGWGTRWAVKGGRERRRARVAACGTTEDDPRAVTVAEAWLA